MSVANKGWYANGLIVKFFGLLVIRFGKISYEFLIYTCSSVENTQSVSVIHILYNGLYFVADTNRITTLMLFYWFILLFLINFYSQTTKKKHKTIAATA